MIDSSEENAADSEESVSNEKSTHDVVVNKASDDESVELVAQESDGVLDNRSSERVNLIRNPTNLLGDVNRELKWFVVHTYSGYEEKVKTAFLNKVKEKGLEKFVGAIHIPQTEKETKTKTGKTRKISRISFPGYMMIQMELTDETKLLVKDTPRITGFVGDNLNPKSLPDHEVRAMLSIDEPELEGDAQVIEQEVIFNKGDAVKVTDGPFSNFDGVVDVVRPDKGKVRVLVSIFGRETPVELEYRQVEQI